MTLSSLSLAWLLLNAPAAPAIDQARYWHADTPFASATLLFEGATDGIAIVSETNVSLQIVPAPYQDLHIVPAFAVICALPENYGIRSVGVWVDNRFHLIPATVTEYKEFNRTFVKLEIELLYFRNKIDDLDLRNHKIHIEFFAR